MKLVVSSIIVSSLIVLSACAPETAGRDYESSAACADRGLKAGDPGYDDCVREEAMSRALRQQRDDYEEQKRQDEFWRNHRY